MIRSVGPAPTSGKDAAESRLKLKGISDDIRGVVPLEAVLPSEAIAHPEANAYLHLDAFLYDEEDEERLLEEGKLPKGICADCGSKNNRLS
ncbi:Uncharacterized protein FKW44_023897, partial [Caligus rogercresseyi]